MLHATHFRKVTSAGIGADPAFSASYEQQRSSFADVSSPKVKGITTSGDVNGVRCQGLVRKIKHLLLDFEITDVEREAGQASLLKMGSNLPRLERWHRNTAKLIADRRAARALQTAA